LNASVRLVDEFVSGAKGLVHESRAVFDLWSQTLGCGPTVGPRRIPPRSIPRKGSGTTNTTTNPELTKIDTMPTRQPFNMYASS